MAVKQVLIALDQVANTLAGGMADETLSARAWRTQNSPLIRLIDAVFFWEADHCKASYNAELLRTQLPKAYRP